MSKKDIVKKKKKGILTKILLLIIGIFFFIQSIGLKNANIVNHVTFVSAIGIDKSPKDENKIIVTFQIIPAQVALDSLGDLDKIVLTSIETTSLEDAMSISHNYLSSIINFSQTRVIVFSEELARQGIERYINSISSSSTFYSSMNILICEKGTAQEYLESMENSTEINPMNYYNIIENAESIGSSSQAVNIMDFLIALHDKVASPIAPLCRVIQEETEGEGQQEKSGEKKEEGKSEEIDNLSQENTNAIPKKSSTKIEVGGLAVFDHDKMVGTLNNDETAYHLMLTKKAKTFFYPLYHPNYANPDETILTNFYIWQTKNATIKFNKSSLKDLRIDVIIPLNASILDTKENTYDFLNNDYMKYLANYLEQDLQKQFQAYFSKLQKDYAVDIDGLIQCSKLYFLTDKDLENFNWKEKYESANISVRFDINFMTSALSTKK